MFKTNAFWRGDERMLRRSHYMGGGNAAFTALPLLVLAVKRQFPLFLLSERRKSGICIFTADSFGGPEGIGSCICNFSSSQGGGNAAFTALPLLVLAVKRQSPLFLLSERRKSGICSFTADSFGGPEGIGSCICNFSSSQGGGNAAFTALPLLVLAVKRQSPLFLLSERRKSGICSFTADSFGGKPAPSAATLFFAFFSF
ncbi:hypothetical protein MRB53_031068 [Persea americana]|uniref:Uncharacterized protein n=1 Tax=Persea americana TaxID=3435 RepID=A0ACC2KMY2_PERAE|nr:hypothetical protein MRB53_031068 [Persea americana]